VEKCYKAEPETNDYGDTPQDTWRVIICYVMAKFLTRRIKPPPIYKQQPNRLL